MILHPFISTLSRYLDGELEEEKTRRFEAHLEKCPACRKKVEVLQAVGRASTPSQVRVDALRRNVLAVLRGRPAPCRVPETAADAGDWAGDAGLSSRTHKGTFLLPRVRPGVAWAAGIFLVAVVAMIVAPRVLIRRHLPEGTVQPDTRPLGIGVQPYLPDAELYPPRAPVTHESAARDLANATPGTSDGLRKTAPSPSVIAAKMPAETPAKMPAKAPAPAPTKTPAGTPTKTPPPPVIPGPAASLSLPGPIPSQPQPTGDPSLVPLQLKLPRPLFIGTPRNFPPSPHLEPPLTAPRPPFLVPAGTINLARGKPVTASTKEVLIGDLKQVTDGDKEALDGSYVELGPGLQWVQIDLREPCELYAILTWHYHADSRVYHDVIVRTADDAAFTKNVQTLFNNDYDNTAGLGEGKDKEFIETFQGKLTDMKKTRARYVRLYSNGNTSNDMNHYTEVEVFGRTAKSLEKELVPLKPDLPKPVFQ